MGVIAGHPRKDAGAVNFERAAPGPDVLVVVIKPGGEVGAEAIAGQPRQRSADADDLVRTQRNRTGDDPVSLIVAAIGRPGRKVRDIVEPPGDLFDRAAHGVAAVKCALRPAQHFDSLNVVDIEHRGLRAVEVNIVKIDADALFKA